MFIRFYGFLLVSFLLSPTVTAFAMEQNFIQNDTRVSIRVNPDLLVPKENVSLTLRLEKGGKRVTDRTVTMEIYEEDAKGPILKRSVDVLDEEYLESWEFEKSGNYLVVLNIIDPAHPQDITRYEVKASVAQPKEAKKGGQGFFEHHFGGSWGWWTGGLMLLMMIPMMILM